MLDSSEQTREGYALRAVKSTKITGPVPRRANRNN
jgi:hypothetical protein